MTPARIRLLVAGCLFTLWIGWLGYLALVASFPIVLSRPQFLAADVWVVAELDGAESPGGEAHIREVLFQRANAAKPSGKLPIANLDVARQDWRGPGLYILPLTKGTNGYRLTPIPTSPGYNEPLHIPKSDNKGWLVNPERLRIYPATDATRAQLEKLK